ncbi:MAG: adenylate/guanylate cyclase domain-containing protein [Chloroflexi bacterium]|nr:adenylate/guanylate cyclase domain-containing protein [Chloroflexota bacterium]
MKKGSYSGRLNDLVSVVSDVAMGDLSRQVEVEGEDELAALGMAINEMISNLKWYRSELAEKIISVVSDVAMGDLSRQVEVEGEDELAALGMAINEMILSLREKELIRNAYGKYVTKQVEELKEGLKLGGETRQVTILLADIKGFTTMAEREDPQEVVRFLNRYFSMMVNVILRYEGTIDRYIGSALLTMFGAPLPQPDHAQRALDAAMAMQRELAVFNRERETEGKQPVRVGIAINTGYAIVGNIGSETKMEYRAVGNTVDVASRLQELNKQFGTEILVTESTCASASKRLKLREIPLAPLRRRKDATRCYAVEGVMA